jgi:hypothetical protein
MTEKTFHDCAGCDVLTSCDAHISGGSWNHKQGVDPCVIVTEGEGS